MVDLRRLAEELNIDDIAVCNAEPFLDVESILIKDKLLGILPPFTEEDINKRIDPSQTLSDAKSFIVILQKYTPTLYKKREGNYGNISPAATGTDYHRIVRDKLNKLSEKLLEDDPNGVYMPFVDNSPFSEKHIALRANMGKILKNGLFYSNFLGSRCFIGILLTNRDVSSFELKSKKDISMKKLDICNTCNACIKACPGGAISDKGFNSYRCVSYFTQKKEELTSEEEAAMGYQIYGCDICQKNCPINGVIAKEYETGTEVDLDQLLAMSNKQFKEVYQATAAGWRGKKQLQRNAEIALKNKEKI